MFTFHQYCFCTPTKTLRVFHGALGKFVGAQNGGQMFDFSNSIVFCLGYRVCKNKKTYTTKNLGGMSPWVLWLRLREHA